MLWSGLPNPVALTAHSIDVGLAVKVDYLFTVENVLDVATGQYKTTNDYAIMLPLLVFFYYISCLFDYGDVSDGTCLRFLVYLTMEPSVMGHALYFLFI
jgi:hypothetical protein